MVLVGVGDDVLVHGDGGVLLLFLLLLQHLREQLNCAHGLHLLLCRFLEFVHGKLHAHFLDLRHKDLEGLFLSALNCLSQLFNLLGFLLEPFLNNLFHVGSRNLVRRWPCAIAHDIAAHGFGFASSPLRLEVRQGKLFALLEDRADVQFLDVQLLLDYSFQILKGHAIAELQLLIPAVLVQSNQLRKSQLLSLLDSNFDDLLFNLLDLVNDCSVLDDLLNLRNQVSGR